MREDVSQHLAWQIAAVTVIWLISLVVSYFPYSYANNAGDWVHAHALNWFNAHSLVSLRALNDWGFVKLLGTASLIPHAHELQGADITAFTGGQGVYLSYPSLWIAFPYLALQFAKLLSPDYEITPFFIVTYSIIVNRLMCGLVVYFIFRYILDDLFHHRLFYNKIGHLGRCILAMIGLAGWMLTAEAMNITQNLYSPDQAVLLPVYCLFLFTLKHKFEFWTLSPIERVLFGTLALLSVGMDWYGLVFVFAVLGSAGLVTCIKHRERPWRKLFRKILINIVFPLLGGAIIALGSFLCQLFYFDEGFSQIVHKFYVRMGMISAAGKPLTYFQVYEVIVISGTGYLSRITEFASITASNLYMPQAAINVAVVFIPLLALMTIPKIRRKPETFAALFLLYITPCIHLILLKQHAYFHAFSLFKMALPISFSTAVLPAVLLVFIASRAGKIISPIAISCIFLATIIIFPAGDYLRSAQKNNQFSTGDRDDVDAGLGAFVRSELSPQEIAFSQHFAMRNWAQPGTVRLWYTDRFIYSPEFFASLRPKLLSKKIDSSDFVFVDYEDAIRKNKIPPNISSVCAGKWFKYATLVGSHRVLGCKVTDLRLMLGR